MTAMDYNNENSGESSCDDKEEDSSENEGVNENAAWANSIAKILKSSKPKKKTTLILSRAKKINDKKAKIGTSLHFEIEGGDGEIKKSENEVKPEIDNAGQRTIKKKKQLPKLCVKPKIMERDRERMLSRIATKGVVQLFNAIRTEQKNIDIQLKDAGPLEVKKDKVLKKVDKRIFLDMLMGNTNTEAIKTTIEKSNVEENSSSWNVLRDDFMMKAKMKDWDKELEQNIEMECEEQLQSD